VGIATRDNTMQTFTTLRQTIIVLDVDQHSYAWKIGYATSNAKLAAIVRSHTGLNRTIPEPDAMIRFADWQVSHFYRLHRNVWGVRLPQPYNQCPSQKNHQPDGQSLQARQSVYRLQWYRSERENGEPLILTRHNQVNIIKPNVDVSPVSDRCRRHETSPIRGAF